MIYLEGIWVKDDKSKRRYGQALHGRTIETTLQESEVHLLACKRTQPKRINPLSKVRFHVPRDLRNILSFAEGIAAPLTRLVNPRSVLVKGKPFHLTLSQTELMPNVTNIENHSFVPFQRLITAAGTLALLYAVVSLNPSQLDARFAALLGMTVLLSSRIVVPIPKLSSQVSVSDTFVFLILLLYGPPAAIIVASSEAFLSSMRFSRKSQTVLFNWGCAALSVFITGSTLKIAFGNTTSLLIQPYTARFMVAICTMALIHYAGNSGIVAIGQALKTNEPIWQTWRRHYLWTSITYFAGAITAAAIAGLLKSIGFPAFVISCQ